MKKRIALQPIGSVKPFYVVCLGIECNNAFVGTYPKHATIICHNTLHRFGQVVFFCKPAECFGFIVKQVKPSKFADNPNTAISILCNHVY